MFLVKMIDFCKRVTCPSSEELLAYQIGNAKKSLAKEIFDHIDKCEFCEAEVEFYKKYPQSEDDIKTEEIPSPLFELAEALLNNKHKDNSFLNKLLNDKEGLTLKKA